MVKMHLRSSVLFRQLKGPKQAMTENFEEAMVRLESRAERGKSGQMMRISEAKEGIAGTLYKARGNGQTLPKAAI